MLKGLILLSLKTLKIHKAQWFQNFCSRGLVLSCCWEWVRGMRSHPFMLVLPSLLFFRNATTFFTPSEERTQQGETRHPYYHGINSLHNESASQKIQIWFSLSICCWDIKRLAYRKFPELLVPWLKFEVSHLICTLEWNVELSKGLWLSGCLDHLNDRCWMDMRRRSWMIFLQGSSLLAKTRRENWCLPHTRLFSGSRAQMWFAKTKGFCWIS